MNYALGITGYPGSGKSILTSIAEDIGYTKVSMGDQIRKRTRDEWSDRLKRAENGESNETPSNVYGTYATEMREKHGRGIVSKWCKEEIVNCETPVLIDGIRSPEELVSFEEYISVDVLFIHAPASLRYEWIKTRARDNEDEFTYDEFMNRDKRENGWGLNELIQDADYTIHNCTELDTFTNSSEKILRELYNKNQ